jgi:hypothetical protein
MPRLLAGTVAIAVAAAVDAGAVVAVAEAPVEYRHHLDSVSDALIMSGRGHRRSLRRPLYWK